MAKYYHSIPTDNYPLTLTFKITASVPVVVKIVGYDANPSHPNSIYFNRDLGTKESPFIGSRVLECPMPITPEKLTVVIYDQLTGSSKPITVSDMKVVPLTTKALIFNKPEDKEFLRFAEEIAQKVGYLPVGVYKSKAGHAIKISKTIYNEQGRESTTPARMFRPNGEIEISKPKFEAMTIPMRMLILLHEFGHWRGNTRQEGQADSYALNMYLARGYPKSEALYAFTKVFTPVNDKHAQALANRTDSLLGFIKNWR